MAKVREGNDRRRGGNTPPPPLLKRTSTQRKSFRSLVMLLSRYPKPGPVARRDAGQGHTAENGHDFQFWAKDAPANMFQWRCRALRAFLPLG